jgi:DNA polymerase III sliding clamp (beta) subunit (PCNA family)
LIGAVKGDELLKILQTMPDDIDIKKKKDKLVISKKSKGSNINITLNMMEIQTDIWPEIPEEFIDLPKNFVEGLKFCLFSVAPNANMGALNCILANDSNIISCDDFRGTQFVLDSKLDEDLLIPLNLAKVLINYDIIKYTQDDSWIFFEDEFGIIICCKKVEYEYPVESVNSLFKTKGDLVTLPEDFKTALDRSEIISQINIEYQKIVKLELLSNKLIISSSGDIGNYKEEIKIDYDGKEITIMVNPIHMKQILEECSEFMITKKNVKFQTDTFNHVIALIAE